MNRRIRRSIIKGIIGSLILLLLFFGILSILNSFSHAVEQFLTIWYWVFLLVVGFGIQVSLYSYVKSSMQIKKAATAEVATTGGVSTGAMIACCAHHIADILPILGLSAAAVFLLKYQVSFLVLGVFSNLVGITMMLNIIQKHNLTDQGSLFTKLFRYNVGTVRNITIIISVIVVLTVFITTIFVGRDLSGSNTIYEIPKQSELPTRTNDENDVVIEVKPIDLSFDREIKFDVAINTHQGSLDYDLTKISILEDSNKNMYVALNWEGSPLGGHHRDGVLTFPKLDQKTTYVKLIIKDIYGVPERVFSWDLVENG